MSEVVKLCKLFINNFKPFPASENPIPISFMDNSQKPVDYFVLSGPNGYGKTTVFQAIEFALSGKIELFSFGGRDRTFSDHIFINTVYKESYVAAEFIDSNGATFSVVRYNPNVAPCLESDCRKAIKGFSLYICESEFEHGNFKEMLSAGPRAENEELLKKLLGTDSIDELLQLLYIRQEFSSSLLFKPNKSRVDYINTFIDSGVYDKVRDFTESSKALDERIHALTQQHSEIAKEQIHAIQQATGDEPESVRVFPAHEIPWDKQKYQVDEPLDGYIDELKKIREMLLEFNACYVMDIHDGISRLLKAPSLLRSLLAYAHYVDKLDILAEKTRLYHLLSSLKIESGILAARPADFEEFSQLSLYITQFQEKTKSIEQLSDNYSRIYEEILSLHNLLSQYKADFGKLCENMCPLCGTSFQNSEFLYRSIQRHRESLQSIQNRLTGQVQTLLEEKSQLLEVIVSLLEKEMANLKYDPALHKLIIDSIQNEDNNERYVKRLQYLLASDERTIQSFFHNATPQTLDAFNEISYELEEYLKIRIEQISQRESLDNITADMLKAYKRVAPFIGSTEPTKLVTVVDKKIKHLEWYIQKRDAERLSIQKEKMVELSSQINTLNSSKEKLKAISDAFERARKRYLENLVKSIEIPLYIYSGKLLQTHQNGLGVFCNTGPQEGMLTSFKLMSNADRSNHDVLNKFSSGQRAALNIAVILAFRKIRRLPLDVFMIDDPCQSLDDLNIASLTEIFKNEFHGMQIIMSTHEDNIASYMCYKYKKAGKYVKKYNVQKELYISHDV